jgi:Lrp/AsnC family transcriptional regulator, regulator for asnA, asnC and gidA
MHGKYDLFVKVRAKDLNHMRDIIENKIGIRPNILKIKLMIILKTEKEEQQIVCTNIVRYIKSDIK